MSNVRGYSGSVRWVGYIFAAGGILGFAFDVAQRSEMLVPTDLGVTLADAAILAIGFVTIVIARCLRSLEQRIGALEANSNRPAPVIESPTS